MLPLGVVAMMVTLFMTGHLLPFPVAPQGTAIIAAAFALLVIHSRKVDPVDPVLRDVDWKTLVFLICMFCLVDAFAETHLLDLLSATVYDRFGTQLLVVALTMLVTAEIVRENALGTLFTAWPGHTIPVFVAVMFSMPAFG